MFKITATQTEQVADEEDVGSCEPAFVTVDNESIPEATELLVEVADYPGLLRIIMWALGGLDVKIQSACMKTLEDGLARDVFWVTDRAGRKLSNKEALLLGERLEELIMVCNDKGKLQDPDTQVFSMGCVEVSNSAKPDFTQVTLTGESMEGPDMLLGMTSLVAAFGGTIHEGIITSSLKAPPCAQIPQDINHDHSKGRFLRFWITDVAGNKLDAARCSALVFVWNMMSNPGHMPTRLPSTTNYCKGGQC